MKFNTARKHLNVPGPPACVAERQGIAKLLYHTVYTYLSHSCGGLGALSCAVSVALLGSGRTLRGRKEFTAFTFSCRAMWPVPTKIQGRAASRVCQFSLELWAEGGSSPAPSSLLTVVLLLFDVCVESLGKDPGRHPLHNSNNCISNNPCKASVRISSNVLSNAAD